MLICIGYINCFSTTCVGKIKVMKVKLLFVIRFSRCKGHNDQSWSQLWLPSQVQSLKLDYRPQVSTSYFHWEWNITCCSFNTAWWLSLKNKHTTTKCFICYAPVQLKLVLHSVLTGLLKLHNHQCKLQYFTLNSVYNCNV